MKFGMRKPSIKKRVKARTTGKVKRKIKSSVNPYYGKKGTGAIRDPKKAMYNKVYNKATVDATKGLKATNTNQTVNDNQAVDNDNQMFSEFLGLLIYIVIVPPIAIFIMTIAQFFIGAGIIMTILGLLVALGCIASVLIISFLHCLSFGLYPKICIFISVINIAIIFIFSLHQFNFLGILYLIAIPIYSAIGLVLKKQSDEEDARESEKT